MDKLDLLLDHYEQLKLQQESAVTRGSYMHAQKFYPQLDSAKKSIQSSQVKELKKKIKQLEEDLRDSYQFDVKNTNQVWNERLMQYREHAELIKINLKEKHNSRLQKLENKLDYEIPKTGKPTPEVLNLRAQSLKALQQKEFGAIHYIKKRIRKLGHGAQKDYELQRSVTIKSKVEAKRNVYNKEIFSLEKRIESGAQDMIKEKTAQLDLLYKKYTNQLKEVRSCTIVKGLKDLFKSQDPKT